MGNDHEIVIPNLGQLRVAEKRLAGIRCFHTHLKGEGLTQDDLNDLLLLRLDAMACAQVRPDGTADKISLAHISPGAEDTYSVFGPASVASANEFFGGLVENVESALRKTVVTKKVGESSSALLIHVSNLPRHAMDFSLDELEELAKSAGITSVERVIQRRSVPDPKYLMGQGKLKEFMIKALSIGADMVIFDAELTAAQIKAISDFTDMDVLDRTQLILGIFEKRAESRDGKIRVKLAQMKYLLPRLGAKESALSRIRGGIGLRGPGETTSEVQRRHLQGRISFFEKELKRLKQKRAQKKGGRIRSGVETISIIGYTNAGKSSLINRLTGSDLMVKNLLFSTLDPASRKIWLGEGRHAVISDTVGLIRNMPETLMGVFRATMEELSEARLIINVVDVSNPDYENHLEVSNKLLEELGLNDTPKITVFNKVDLIDAEMAQNVCKLCKGIGVSAESGTGINELLSEISEKLYPPNRSEECDINKL
ncbi:MAG: GTPase HflX [Nitrospinae bacterium]|nr:GTPase HflX [Nitrospinota bacterium]